MHAKQNPSAHRLFADQLLTAPLSGRRLDRLQLMQVAEANPSAQQQLMDTWGDCKIAALPDMFVLSGVLNCLPSLVTLGADRPHTNEVAQTVNSNMAYLAEGILTIKRLEAHLIGRLNSANRMRLSGRMGELGVLGALWWSVANGMRDPATYILPTTSDKDASDNDRLYVTGVDMIMHLPGGIQQPIQAKTRATARRLQEDYQPGIAVINLRELTDAKGVSLTGARHLLHLLKIGDQKALGAINKQINLKLIRATKRRDELADSTVSVLFRHAVRARTT